MSRIMLILGLLAATLPAAAFLTACHTDNALLNYNPKDNPEDRRFVWGIPQADP
jgi:hypothetical protein